jgi:hypothetical protein
MCFTGINTMVTIACYDCKTFLKAASKQSGKFDADGKKA